MPDIIEAFSILEQNPNLWSLNQNVIQRSVSKEILKVINSNFDKMIVKARIFAKENEIVLNAGFTIKKTLIHYNKV